MVKYMDAPVKRRFIRMGGVIHLSDGGEHLVCATATFDAADSEGDETLRWHDTDKTTVTCEGCAAVIRLCAGVKVSKDPKPPRGM